VSQRARPRWPPACPTLWNCRLSSAASPGHMPPVPTPRVLVDTLGAWGLRSGYHESKTWLLVLLARGLGPDAGAPAANMFSREQSA
jgi:hypothetical protein